MEFDNGLKKRFGDWTFVLSCGPGVCDLKYLDDDEDVEEDAEIRGLCEEAYRETFDIEGVLLEVRGVLAGLENEYEGQDWGFTLEKEDDPEEFSLACLVRRYGKETSILMDFRSRLDEKEKEAVERTAETPRKVRLCPGVECPVSYTHLRAHET